MSYVSQFLYSFPSLNIKNLRFWETLALNHARMIGPIKYVLGKSHQSYEGRQGQRINIQEILNVLVLTYLEKNRDRL